MVNKAIIPVAGVGKRLWPFTKAVPKAMLPLPWRGEALLPVVHLICAEAAAAGIEDVLLVVSPEQRRLVQAYLAVAEAGQPPLPKRIELADQQAASGFGAAIMAGRDFAGREPFMVLLGDHVYIAGHGADPCAAQVAKAHAAFGGSAMIGVQPVGAGQLSGVGVPRGQPVGHRTYRCTDFVEKPDVDTARNRLATEGLPVGKYLAHCGIYVFDTEIFDCLTALERSRPASADGREFQLADAQSMLLERSPEGYLLYRINGRAYDTGTAGNYAKAVAAFARHSLRVSR